MVQRQTRRTARMSSKVSLLVGAGFMVASIASAAPHAGFQLLSAQEYQSELAARATPGAAITLRAADFDAPAITVVKPDRSAPIQPPVDIDVHFKAAQGASVNVASLKIMYGFLKRDVTKRLLAPPGATVSAAGPKA